MNIGGTDIESPDFNVIYLKLAMDRWLSGKKHTIEPFV